MESRDKRGRDRDEKGDEASSIKISGYATDLEVIKR